MRNKQDIREQLNLRFIKPFDDNGFVSLRSSRPIIEVFSSPPSTKLFFPPSLNGSANAPLWARALPHLPPSETKVIELEHTSNGLHIFDSGTSQNRLGRHQSSHMTSTATPQNSTQATNTAAHSYASAASASKKPANPNTVVASGSTPAPVVVGSSAKSASPANGRPAIPPAVPVVHGSVNGGAADHARKPSVTISANGPPSYGANGGPVGSSKSAIQFGFRDSPVVSHSTPQPGAASPIPIPGTGHARVASPAHSPSPIPQPAASGGRPPAGLQSGDVKPSFGSFNNDPEVCLGLHSLFLDFFF